MTEHGWENLLVLKYLSLSTVYNLMKVLNITQMQVFVSAILRKYLNSKYSKPTNQRRICQLRHSQFYCMLLLKCCSYIFTECVSKKLA